MAYKAKPKAAPKKEPEQKEQPKRLCGICGEDAVIQHNGEFYCQPHYSIRLESVSHEEVVERHKRGDNKPRAIAG